MKYEKHLLKYLLNCNYHFLLLVYKFIKQLNNCLMFLYDRSTLIKPFRKTILPLNI